MNFLHAHRAFDHLVCQKKNQILNFLIFYLILLFTPVQMHMSTAAFSLSVITPPGFTDQMFIAATTRSPHGVHGMWIDWFSKQSRVHGSNNWQSFVKYVRSLSWLLSFDFVLRCAMRVNHNCLCSCLATWHGLAYDLSLTTARVDLDIWGTVDGEFTGPLCR